MEHNLLKGIDFIGVGVSFFCHDGKGNIVMAKRNHNARDEHGAWDIGAGGVDFGQTIEETLHKEIKEEYCTDIVHEEFLGYRTVFREINGKQSHWVMFDFKVEVKPEMVKNGEPHKLEEVSWFTFNNLPEHLHSQVPNFLKLYRERLES